jgi:nucleoside-diphosphate-sugar epimerase
MDDSGLDVVTGAFSFTGRFIAARLLAMGRRVRTLTGHPDRPDPFAGAIEVEPYRFDDGEALVHSLEGAATLYNTYWVRFQHGSTSFDQTIANSRALFEAARVAGVRRIVHVSITNPVEGALLPYFRGKALVERHLQEAGVRCSIVRPTVVFGPGDVLVNNIAWLLRRIPVFAIPGAGDYLIRPVHVDDLARLCVECSQAGADVVLDAVGPETLTFVDMVGVIRAAVNSRAWLVRVPPTAAAPLAYLLGLALRDVLLTRDELTGMIQNLVTTNGPPTGRIVFSEWVREHATELGTSYASELQRHFEGG